MSSSVGVGVIGAGTISDTYLENLSNSPTPRCSPSATLSPMPPRKRRPSTKFPPPEMWLPFSTTQISRSLSTSPFRRPTRRSRLRRSPLASTSGMRNLSPSIALAAEACFATLEEAGLLVGCAPDTFLGAGLQTACRLVEQGLIGTPLTALALLQLPGPELWHPNPAFLYAAGAGPLFDLGPYYLTALVQVFGQCLRSPHLDRRPGSGGSSAPDRRRGRNSMSQCPATSVRWSSTSRASPPKPCSPSTPRCLVPCWRSMAPRQRCCFPTPTTSTADCRQKTRW